MTRDIITAISFSVNTHQANSDLTVSICGVPSLLLVIVPFIDLFRDVFDEIIVKFSVTMSLAFEINMILSLRSLKKVTQTMLSHSLCTSKRTRV